MTAHDLFHLTACNLDPLTETYDIAFYLDYLSKWPELCSVIEGTDGRIEAYSAFISIVLRTEVMPLLSLIEDI